MGPGALLGDCDLAPRRAFQCLDLLPLLNARTALALCTCSRLFYALSATVPQIFDTCNERTLCRTRWSRGERQRNQYHKEKSDDKVQGHIARLVIRVGRHGGQI